MQAKQQWPAIKLDNSFVYNVQSSSYFSFSEIIDQRIGMDYSVVNPEIMSRTSPTFRIK